MATTSGTAPSDMKASFLCLLPGERKHADTRKVRSVTAGGAARIYAQRAHSARAGLLSRRAARQRCEAGPQRRRARRGGAAGGHAPMTWFLISRSARRRAAASPERSAATAEASPAVAVRPAPPAPLVMASQASRLAHGAAPRSTALPLARAAAPPAAAAAPRTARARTAARRREDGTRNSVPIS
jgi:hypothetical protein